MQATTALHNYIIQYEATLPPTERIYSNNSTEDNTNLIYAGAFTEMNALNTNSHGQYAAQVREFYADFFMNTGAVEWQWDKALSNDF